MLLQGLRTDHKYCDNTLESMKFVDEWYLRRKEVGRPDPYS